METRSIKELLQIMLDNQDLFESGLCSWVYRLYDLCYVTLEEYFILDEYIDNNRPFIFSTLETLCHCIDVYYWNMGNIKPRIKWIEKHIKLNS